MTGPNEYAFPGPNDGNVPGAPGIDVRTYLAAKAMQGLLACRDFSLFLHEGAEMNDALLAQNSVEIADALIAALNKKDSK